MPSSPEDWLRDFRGGRLSGKHLLQRLEKHLYQDRFHLIRDSKKKSLKTPFARLDAQRKLKSGIEEVILAEGKSDIYLQKIVKELLPPSGKGKGKTHSLLITRLSPDSYLKLKNYYQVETQSELPLTYHPEFRIAHTPFSKKKILKKSVAILTAGTADIPVAEECHIVLQYWGIGSKKYYDIGVASLDRLLGLIGELKKFRVVIVVAGMEAALASVMGGLVKAPVIAVPTSVGYGAHFKGLSSLLGMMNSCSPGVVVVNIDNGFGAAAAAQKILNA